MVGSRFRQVQAPPSTTSPLPVVRAGVFGMQRTSDQIRSSELAGQVIDIIHLINGEMTMRPALNPLVLSLKESATLAINLKALELRRQGKDIVHFGFGQSPFPVPEIIQAALRDNVDKKMMNGPSAAWRNFTRKEPLSRAGFRKSFVDVLLRMVGLTNRAQFR
jgi:hypothetical protein